MKSPARQPHGTLYRCPSMFIVNSNAGIFWSLVQWQVSLGFILAMVIIISYPVTTWGGAGILAPYPADFAASDGFSFVAITNTSTSPIAIKAKIDKPDGHPIMTDHAVIAADGTWILGLAKPVCLGGGTKGKPADFNLSTNYTVYQNMELNVVFDAPVAEGINIRRNKVDLSSRESALASGLDVPDSLWPSTVIVNVKKKANSDFFSAIKPCANTGAARLPSSIKALDEKISRFIVNELNKKHVADKGVLEVGKNILKKDFRLRKLIKDRAKLSKKFAGQSKTDKKKKKEKRAVSGGRPSVIFAHDTHHGQKTVTGNDDYWLDKKRGGHKFQGATVCKACLHALANERHSLYRERAIYRLEKDIQSQLSALKKEQTTGYTVQAKKRLKEEIKDVERMLQKAKDNTYAAQKEIVKANIRVADCTKKHCKKKGKITQKGSRLKGVSKKSGAGTETPALKIGGCVFIPPTHLSNYRKGMSGLPDDIPELPGATFGESFNHSSGKSFQMGSMKSPALTESSYKKQLQKKGWKILKEDALSTKFGQFQRLFAKTKNACLSVVAAKAPAGMPHKTVLSIYTYPGSGKYKPLKAGDIKLSTGYVKDEFQQQKGRKIAGKNAGKRDAVSGLKLSTGFVEQEPGVKVKKTTRPKDKTGAHTGGNTGMGVVQIVGGAISHAFDAIGECKECASLFKQYMAVSKKVADLESRGAHEVAPGDPLAAMEPPEFKQRRALKKKLEACLKKCESKKKAASKKPALPPDDNVCIPGANDIANPIIHDMPASESAANKAKSAVGNFAKGAIGGLLGGSGGMFGGGQSGARLMNTPKGPWYKFSSGETNVKIGGWVYKPRSKKKKPEIRIAQRITDSPDHGGPHMMILQNRDGQILRPTGYMIFEVWRLWKLTITITRDTWVNGEHTSHTVTRESTQWRELADRYKRTMEAPGIWEQFGVAPFGKLKGIIAQFPLPDNFNPAEWTLVKHDTAKAMVNGKEVIKTVPFVVSIGQGEKNRLTFKSPPDGKTAYQRAHGCQSLDEAMHDLMTRYEQDSGLNESGKPQKKPSPYKIKKTKQDASRLAGVLIMQPGAGDRWLKDYHKLSQKMQISTTMAMADIMLRMITGAGLGIWDPQQWQKDLDQLDLHVRHLAVAAANRWKPDGKNRKLLAELSRSYPKLSPRLKRIFNAQFIYALSANMALDLGLPHPVAY